MRMRMREQTKHTNLWPVVFLEQILQPAIKWTRGKNKKYLHMLLKKIGLQSSINSVYLFWGERDSSSFSQTGHIGRFKRGLGCSCWASSDLIVLVVINNYLWEAEAGVAAFALEVEDLVLWCYTRHSFQHKQCFASHLFGNFGCNCNDQW